MHSVNGLAGSNIQLQGVLVKPRVLRFPITFKDEIDRISTALLSHVDVDVLFIILNSFFFFLYNLVLYNDSQIEY